PVISMYYFFFSSRRRHTSSKRDWSSDVCSSDLCKPICCTVAQLVRCLRHLLFRSRRTLARYFMPLAIFKTGSQTITQSRTRHSRSEERRVGQEWSDEAAMEP